eukprot:GILI01019949.1.p1 GENE.GILI01019949.1~~GILI01019949.1.p1  ORF type:complete len:547 (+),score=91.14 GILI01019949.1:44-1684(+)
MPPSNAPQPKPELLGRIDRCLAQFQAKQVKSIEDAYEYVPDIARARMGAGSYGETFRMRNKQNLREPPRIVKFISKARIATADLQVQHLCVELAVLKLVNHPNLNHSTDLLHSESTIFIVLELCEGHTPSVETRLYHLLAKFHPSRIAEVPSMLATLKEECEGLSDEDKALKEEELVRKECVGVNKKEIPISSDLFNCIVANSRLLPAKSAVIVKGVLQGLNHLHEKNIVHRDMKTENIVLGETRTSAPIKDADGKVIGVRLTEKVDVKVIDFGLVKYMNLSSFPSTPSPGCFGMSDDPFARAASDVFDNTPSSAGSHLIQQTPGIVDVTPCGTEIYCALEVLDGIVGSGFGRRKWQTTKDQLPKFDVYGAGTALYCMINGRPPFRVSQQRRAASREERINEIKQQVTFGPAYWASNCPADLKDFVLSLMKNDVRSRPSTREALRSPILSSVGDTVSYEVMLDGTIQNVTAAPVFTTSSTSRSAPISTATLKKNEESKSQEEHEELPEEETVSDIEQERKDLDDIMAAVRGQEDDGDSNGKPALDA